MGVLLVRVPGGMPRLERAGLIVAFGLGLGLGVLLGMGLCVYLLGGAR